VSTLEQTPEVVYVEVMALLYTDAIDRYLGDLARRGKAERTRDTYRRTLDDFNDTLPYRTVVSEVTANDCRRYLDRFNHLSPATRAQKDSILRGHFKWLFGEGEIKASPMERMLPPKRERDEDKDVTAITADDVRTMLEEAQGWTERLSLGVLAYMGPRLSATANLRVSDYDQTSRRLRFFEKGSKTIWKPVPTALAQLLDESLLEPRSLGWKLDKGKWVHRGYRKVEPDDYLIPSATSHRNAKRDNRVVSKAVQRVSKRTGIKATPHTFRAAFAVFFLERNPGELHSLKELLGHRSILTTQIYLRRLNRETAMERVRDLDWGSEVPANSEIGMETSFVTEKEGFEPSMPPSLDQQKASAQPAGNPLVDSLVERIQNTAPDREKAS
jgi:site-specific recombinase XerD